jgi:cellulose synthase/poly-beta-1,6-N-acetylglucosamine synthase-like glycosyltransferase
MENRSVATATIEVNAVTTTLQEPSLLSASLNKQQVIALLKKHGVADTIFLESPDVRAENLIPTLRKAKVKLPEAFFQDLAAEIGLTFLNIDEINSHCRGGTPFNFLTALPYRVIAEYLIIPLQITPMTAHLALENPLNRKTMMVIQVLLGERKVTWYLASSESIDMAVEKVYREIHKHNALLDLYYRNPDESAHKVLYTNQKYWIIGTIIAIIVAAVVSSVLTFAVLFAAINVAYFMINPLKIYISVRGFQKSKNISCVSAEQLKETKDKDLPVFTVLVPVFHEAAMLPQVMRNLYSLNYPKDKLDVKILMEEKDEETLEEARRLGLFGDLKKPVEGIPAEDYRAFLKVFDPVVIPQADITTKPRACNYGLLRAKGKYCVIYDAEDNPNKDQLKKAAIAFACADENIACLQSKLNFYNANENTLSKWFSIEYSYWYDFYLEGLDRVDAPIPLGGTSNHFRIDQLRELGGWDPYNVTEDADLGLRIARRKLRTAMLESYTYEESPLRVWSWIKQRSRWYKGHAQTYLVHMRHPLKLRQELGWRKFFLFQLTFGGSIFMPIINPILWGITAISLFAPWLFSSLYLLPIQSICIFNLVVGNSAYLILYLAAAIKKKNYRALPYAITMPAYWMLISVAAWRGLIQLITKPFYWEKTSHGVTKNKK